MFPDPLEQNRIAVVYNIPIACNRSTADFMISSPLMNDRYEPVLKDYEEYMNRRNSCRDNSMRDTAHGARDTART